jgi:hypothetical protein
MMQQYPTTSSTQTIQKAESTVRSKISRLLSIVIASGALALLIFHNETNQSAMGKAAYLAAEGKSYDQFLAHPQIGYIIFSFLLICFYFGVYELIAFVIYKMIAEKPI